MKTRGGSEQSEASEQSEVGRKSETVQKSELSEIKKIFFGNQNSDPTLIKKI
uniref:Uncharacterized protein n=1 Tax=Meloidogyne incognita TaxID=6306 RepID=A0A914KX46_MELIC